MANVPADKPGQSPAHIVSDPTKTRAHVSDPTEPEAPLLSLVDKPMEQMSEEELREHVQKLREHAGSGQTLNAAIKRPKGAKKQTTQRKRKRKNTVLELPDEAPDEEEVAVIDPAKYAL